MPKIHVSLVSAHADPEPLGPHNFDFCPRAGETVMLQQTDNLIIHAHVVSVMHSSCNTKDSRTSIQVISLGSDRLDAFVARHGLSDPPSTPDASPG